MILVFSMIEKNNKYNLLDENISNKIESINVQNDDCEVSQLVINNNTSYKVISKNLK